MTFRLYKKSAYPILKASPLSYSEAPAKEEYDWFVKYEVVGFPCAQTAGPYTHGEAINHEQDIMGYEGVRNVERYSVKKGQKHDSTLSKL